MEWNIFMKLNLETLDKIMREISVAEYNFYSDDKTDSDSAVNTSEFIGET